jgi:hypothetical protein
MCTFAHDLVIVLFNVRNWIDNQLGQVSSIRPAHFLAKNLRVRAREGKIFSGQ